MRSFIMSEVLEHGLNIRQARIQETRSYLARTHELFEQFGSQELKTSHAKFEELKKALDSDSQVLLVVIGEFSRGKSSLVNALLGIHLLRSAQEATTAINTFVKAIPEGRNERFIRIHYQDGRTPDEITWDSDDVLEKWGTELNSDHADARKLVDYIEVFTSHPLLDKGLVLIDTPGLQSVVQHHEEITRRAIAEAHIAIWVQSTAQLGGNATEWQFLSQTIRKNFRKFITVINMWDAVLEPTDYHEQKKSEDVRVYEKLERVRQNFRKNLFGIAEDELEALTNPEHLMGVSALWQLSHDPQKQARSGVDKLAERISVMFSSGEALEQIYLKPLQQLSHIQEQLIGSIVDELEQLASNDTLEERQRAADNLSKDIKILEQDMQQENNSAKQEHDNAAKVLASQIKDQLIQPLKYLKQDIETQVDRSYIEKLLQQKKAKISLPPELDSEFEAVGKQVAHSWELQKNQLGKTLEELRTDYAQKMQKHAGQLKAGLSSSNISLPALDISVNVDLSAMEEHYQRSMELQQKMQERQEQIDKWEAEKSTIINNPELVAMAKEDVKSAERQMERLGSCPSSVTRSRREKVSDYGSGFLWLSPTYETYQYEDYSAQNEWKEQRAQAEKKLVNKQGRVEQIIKEEEQKTGRRMSLEQAQKKYEKELAEFKRKQEKLEKEAKDQHQATVDEALHKLIKTTAGQLQQRIDYLEKQVLQSITQVFDEQLKLLQGCVEEQYLEPLNAKKRQREENIKLFEQGKEQVEHRKAQLAEAQQEVNQLRDLTLSALSYNS